MTDATFADLGIAEPLCRALTAANYTTPTPIQARAIPMLLTGRDLLGIAQTGTGKTAAFALPILQRLSLDTGKRESKTVRALILAPTRELVIQIEEGLRTYGRHLNLRFTAVYGGVNQFRQVKALQNGVDILVATPGRLLDLLNQKHVRLDRVKTLVLDEADRMLDMGFIRDVNKIVAAVPRERQSLLFSATMPSTIAHLAAEILNDPLRVEVTPEVVTVDKIDQHVLHVDGKRKRELLEKLLANPELERVIVFTRTKHCANRVSEQLEKSGVSTTSIHGNKSQNARQKALEEFRSGQARVLVATDIAARGIDVSGITHVINYELPDEPESYVHRIGRTARAGKNGIALAFCDASERRSLRDIERLTRKPLQVMDISAMMGGAPMVFEEEPRRPREQNRRRPQQGKKPGGHGKPHGHGHARAAHEHNGHEHASHSQPGHRQGPAKSNDSNNNGGQRKENGPRPHAAKGGSKPDNRPQQSRRNPNNVPRRPQPISA
jgi:ATP-dependent RNA helicase RhlE